tara:strand:+ start:19 stop:339 length:321 start_codon:yes stop_codon:yes gene_type:complete
MFFNLPDEIIRTIYSFDGTYKIVFDEVLEQIQRFKIYQNEFMFCIYDEKLQTMHSTDSLVDPKWISSNFHISKQRMEQIIQDNRLFRNKKDSMHFDIEQYEFHTTR